MKRLATPVLSCSGESALRQYEYTLRETAASLIDVSPHNLRHRSGYHMAEMVPLHRLAQIYDHALYSWHKARFAARGGENRMDISNAEKQNDEKVEIFYCPHSTKS